ncbi:MAG: outer membrane protein assembly factor BamB family protein [Solirubrobacteraceae bacterium]
MRRLTLAATVVIAAAGCGGGASDGAQAPVTAKPPASALAAATRNRDWPIFGVTSDRANVTPAGANPTRLRARRLRVPGTVDSSPIYLHAVRVAGATRDVFVVTTTYGRTLALDARGGRALWTFTPAGIGRWEGSAQITNSAPAADPDRRFVYATSPDGLVHKLTLADGREAAGWPLSVTRDPTHEKLTSSLNISGPYVVATTGGYIGDAPPYQGKVVTIRRDSGAIAGVFNSLCSDRKTIIVPSSCDASDSAIWARRGAVVQPGTGRLLVTTGNGPWNGRTNWGDSVLLLSPDTRTLLGHWTPPNQAELEAGDTDPSSTGPALLGGDLVAQSGKDGKIHLLSLKRMRSAGARPVTGGELQTLSTPGGQPMFSDPAVWRHGGRTTMFATTQGGTAAYAVRRGRLRVSWQNRTGGTSPVLAGGLLYVQALDGGVDVYRPGSGRKVAHLAGGPSHWQSPVIGGGRVLVAEGDANDHATSGTLRLFVPAGA